MNIFYLKKKYLDAIVGGRGVLKCNFLDIDKDGKIIECPMSKDDCKKVFDSQPPERRIIMNKIL